MKVLIPVSNPWVAVDLDGTIMEDGHYPSFGPPAPGAREALLELRSLGIKIMIYTARTAPTDFDGHFQNLNKVVSDIEKWCKDNDMPYDYIWPLPKPTFVLAFFDDRSIHVSPHSEKANWKAAIEEFKNRFAGRLHDWVKAALPPEVKQC